VKAQGLAAGVKHRDTFSATLFNTALNIVLEGAVKREILFIIPNKSPLILLILF